MIAALDVSYEENSAAVAAAVVFRHFADREPVAEYTAGIRRFGGYVPGRFFKRELPCLLAVLESVRENPETVIVDGYATLGGQSGVGYHLWQKLGERVAVIGVAKTMFATADPVRIFRGGSRRPLYITSVGLDPVSAADCIAAMHGAHRIPTLLKRADRLAKQGITAYRAKGRLPA